MSAEPPSKMQKTTTTNLPKGEDIRMADFPLTKELPSLPFVHEYENGRFYFVRECYEEYYALVENMLIHGKRCVTVTGTPGIGKSVFYAYFFQRFRQEESDTWIIAIAFSDRNFKKAAVFDNNGNCEQLLYPSEMESAIDAASKRAYAAKKKVLFLCDGPPNRVRADGQMVVFASPNVKWLKIMRKHFSMLYMPLWTCVELQEAALALGLDCFTEDEIEKRFNLFGGVARECFLSSKVHVEIAQEELINEIGRVCSPGELQKVIRGDENSLYCHRVLHYVPDAALGAMGKTTKLASSFVGQSLAVYMLQSAKHERDKLCFSLEGILQGAELAGWIFNIGVHEALERGCILNGRVLQECDSTLDSERYEMITIQMTSQVDVFELKSLSPAAGTLGPYHKSALKQFESIDAFYLPRMDRSNKVVRNEDLIAWNSKHRLLLSQMTNSETRPVHAFEIISVEKFGLLEAVKENPERVALVFVVPQSIARNYKPQKIIPDVTNGTVQSVRGIGVQTVKKKLSKLKIYTIDQLKKAIETNVLPPKTITASALKNLESMRDSSYSDAMAKIPQFVCSVSIPEVVTT